MAVSTRQALLQALSSAGGSYVSGQQLAETLGVSRAAVHKAAAALTAQGYALEAAPRRGYRLAGGDPFCAEAIGDYPAPIYLYDTLESSNRTAKLLALDGAPHGTLVLTAHQSAGRGRLGRRFESPAGKGVYCSVLLRPEMPAANAQSATISAAVAVCRAVKKLCGLDLAIKWVNDLYYKGKKVCGILTEAGTDLESGRLEWLVVGIGLNLTSTAADWPEQGMQQLHDLGFKTAAMALSDRSVSIDDPALAAEPKLAIVLGTEGDGLAGSTIAACDYTVKIPMSHGVDSLNVAAASAVAFWQLGQL